MVNPLQPARSPALSPNMSPKTTPESFSPLHPATPVGPSPLAGVKPLAPLAPPSRRASSACGDPREVREVRRASSPFGDSRRPSYVGAGALATEHRDSLGLGLGGLGLGLSPVAPRASISGGSPAFGPSPLHPPSRSASPNPSPRPALKAVAPLGPPIVEDPNWKEGDFELISSDNVRFRIASFHLLSASNALRSANEFESARHRRHIQFSHGEDEIESALVIRSFLRIVTTGQVSTTPDGKGTPSVAALRRLILFVKKYECPVALQLILFKIKDMLAQGVSVPMYSFILGATADDIDTCCVSLKYMEQTWAEKQAASASASASATGAGSGASGFGSGSTSGPASIQNGSSPDVDVRNEPTPGVSTIDPNNIPYTLWQWIPQDYMWALSRSWGRHVKDPRARLPDEFKRVINLIKASAHEGRGPSVMFQQ